MDPDGAGLTRNMDLPTHEQDPLLPPCQCGQPARRSYSALPQSESNQSPATKKLEGFFGLLVFTSICLFIGAAIQRAISTSIFDPAVRDQIRQEWEIAYTNHTLRMDRMQEAWEVEVERHSQLRQENIAERRQWDAECRARERVREEERMEEVARQRRQRKKEEEEEERRRAGLGWGELQKSERCLRHGTRKYWSKLQSHEGYNAFKACQETEIEIHGRKILPTYCDDQGMWGGVFGNWIVDFDEPACGTYWSVIYDEGCTANGSGLRRIHARLENYDAADDWTEMCSSTPARFNGLSFDGPVSCKNYGEGGVFGFWVIDDGACR